MEDDGPGEQRAAAPEEHTDTHDKPPQREARSSPGRGLLALLACLGLGFLLYTYLSPEPGPENRLFTPAELARYDGTAGRRLYLAVVGDVFDVTSGRRHYGKRGGYRHFAGRDASKSFVTGDFKKDLTDDLTGLIPEQVADIVNWRDFYRKHKTYFKVGRVVGRFFTAAGEPTEALAEAEAAAAAVAAKRGASRASPASGQQGADEAGQGAYLPCNVKWTKAEGGWVWCPDEGHPRKVAVPRASGAVTERCGCFQTTAVTEGRRLYDGCGAEATRCQTSPQEPDA